MLTVASAAALDSVAVRCASELAIGQKITAEWDKVENASAYTVVVSTDGKEIWRSESTDDTSMPIDGSVFQSVGEYTILVLATAKGYSQSQGAAVVSVIKPAATFELISPIAGTYVSTEVIPIKVTNPDGHRIAVRIMKGNVPVAYFPVDGSTTSDAEYTAAYVPADVGEFTVDVLAWGTNKRGDDA